MLLGETCAENLVDVVHIVPTVSRVIVEHHLNLRFLEIRHIVRLRCNRSACKLVHHLGHVVVVCELRAVHEIREVGIHGSTQ